MMMTDRFKSGDYLKKLYLMALIRRFEETINDFFVRGLIFGTTHLCVGEEATAVGACSPLKNGDFVASTHRGHGHALARGVDLRKLTAELLGRDEGLCRGRGGTQHLSDFSVGFLGTNGITGGFIPVATGTALSFKMRKKDNAVISFFGDGAVNTGYFHESMNFAGLHKLPIIFFCENNQYAMSMPVGRSSAVESVAERAGAYNIPGMRINGMDVLEVERETGNALDRARRGEGPSLIEAVTYRYCGHSKSDMCIYRTREEEELWRKRDPLESFARFLVNEGFNEEEVMDTREKANREVSASFEWALKLPEPGGDVLKGLYSEQEW